MIVVNPLVPTRDEEGQRSVRQRGMYFILEQANRISSRNLLREHLHSLAARHPRTAFFLIQPPGSGTPLFTPSMGFGASLTALRYGYTSTREWLLACGTELMRRLQAVA